MLAANRAAGITAALRSKDALAAAAVALAILAAAEGAARWLHQLQRTTSSYEAPRNPHHRRGWVDYTRVPEDRRVPQDREPARSPSAAPLVVLSHSQAYFRQTREPERIYPARLQRLLADAGEPGRRVLNWSIDGGRTLESLYLAARAVEHRPALVLYVWSPRSFDGDTFEHRPSYWASDAWLLGHLPTVRATLPEDLVALADRQRFAGWTRAHTGLGWLRSRWFGLQMDRWRVWKLEERLADPSARRGWHGPQSFAQEVADRALEDLVAIIERSAGTRLAIVVAPDRWPTLGNPDPGGDAFLERARAATAGRPAMTVLDARRAVPAEHFYDAVHFDRRGHEAMARWLEPRVRELLAAKASR